MQRNGYAGGTCAGNLKDCSGACFSGTPIGEEEDSHLGDFIQDDNVPVPAEAAAQTLLKEQLDEVLDTLTEREQKVLRLRFGMNDGRARTLEEVGKEFDVTRERIRQIEAKSAQKAPSSEPQQKIKRLFRLMMELSTRLQAVADFVTAGYKLADIGTDHAYIPLHWWNRIAFPERSQWTLMKDRCRGRENI